MRVRNLPFWALLTCIPVVLFALNSNATNVKADQVNSDLTTVVDHNVAANDLVVNNQADSNDLSLDEGATDEWWGRGGWGGGWGRGWGWGGGWGGGWGRGWGWGGGWGWPYYGYGYGWPYYGYGWGY